MITAKEITIDLSGEANATSGTMFKGTVRAGNRELYKIITWLTNSKFPSAKYIFWIKENVRQGEKAKEFTPRSVNIKEGKNGLYLDGPIFEMDGLKFPLGGVLDLENGSITLGLASEKQRAYYTSKGAHFVYEINEGDEYTESIPF